MKKCMIEDKHSDMGQRIERCFLCNMKIGKSYQEKLNERIAAIPHEKKQTLLDLMHSGKTLGEARIECGIEEIEVAAGIVIENIHKYEYVGTDAV